MADVRVVCRPEIATGFALAGLRPVEFSSDDEGRERLQDLLAERELGVVLVEAGFYDRLPEEMRRQFGRRPLPMIVPFPDPSWAEKPDAAEAYIVELLRQVIGYRVRLR
jgi:vacuolar-type H+-ATPase subunit F/Vma7